VSRFPPSLLAVSRGIRFGGVPSIGSGVEHDDRSDDERCFEKSQRAGGVLQPIGEQGVVGRRSHVQNRPGVVHDEFRVGDDQVRADVSGPPDDERRAEAAGRRARRRRGQRLLIPSGQRCGRRGRPPARAAACRSDRGRSRPRDRAQALDRRTPTQRRGTPRRRGGRTVSRVSCAARPGTGVDRRSRGSVGPAWSRGGQETVAVPSTARASEPKASERF
jgi:hypothetical protein